VPAVDANAVERARGGDRAALEALVRAVQDPIYRLSLRMLWHPADAEDATQEILVRLVTRLDGFRGDAAFTTWAHRVAVNHLLTTRRRRAESQSLSFEAFGDDLARGLDEPHDPRGVDEALLAEEVKVGCTQAMLLCLDREHRAAYILGEVFELESGDAAYALEVTPAAYRKRLQRARERVQGFMAGHCGIVDPANACRCRRRIGTAMAQGRVDPGNLLYARRGVAEMERLHSAAAVMRSHPEVRAPQRIMALLEQTWIAGRPAGSRPGSHRAARG